MAAQQIDRRQFGVAQEIERAGKQHRHHARVLHGDHALFVEMFEMIGGDRIVTASQVRSAAVGELLGVHLDRQTELRGRLINPLALSDGKANALAEDVHAIDQTFVRQGGKHLIANGTNVVVRPARKFRRKSVRAEKSGVNGHRDIGRPIVARP